MTMPEATPRAKFNAKILVQNRAVASQIAWPVFSHMPSKMTMSRPSPMDSGGKM
jgi:hypothetical protein